MSRTRFRVNPHSIVASMSRNSLLEAGAKTDFNYSANTIHSPIYSVNNIFICFSVTLAAIIRILLIGIDVWL